MLAIIAVVVGMAVPTLHGFAQGHRTINCAEQIVALTQWAHTEAVTRGETYRLNIDPNRRAYWLTVQRDDGQFVNVGREIGQQFIAPDGVMLSWDAPKHDDGQYLQFMPTGRTDPGNIQLTGPDGKVIRIACFSATELYHIVTDQEKQQGL